MKNWFLIVFFFLHHEINAQTISTYAGTGIYDPNGLAFDTYGNLYVGSPLGNKILKIDTSGLISTIAGTGASGFSGDNGPATLATLDQPGGIVIDSIGNVLFCDVANSGIRKINVATGIITTIIGNDTAGFYGDAGPASAASINLPSTICFDNLGNFYIADAGNIRLRKVNTSGTISTIAGNGILGSTGDGGLATAAECYPAGICCDDTGNIYINESAVVGSTYRVRKINSLGFISTITGNSTTCTYNGDGIPATSANVGCSYVAFHDGNLYLSDGCNKRIRMIDNSGRIQTVAGNGIAASTGNGGLADSASIYGPSGIAFDRCGNLYISQVNAPCIRKVAFNPLCWPAEVPEIPISEKITIYPNPTTSELNIENVETGTKYSLFNVTGIIEQTGTLKPGKNSIAIETLPPGIHILQLTDNNGQKTVRKIVKE